MITFNEWKTTDIIKSYDEIQADENLAFIVFDYIPEFDELHEFPEGSWFVRKGDLYLCHCGRDDIETSDIEEVREFLWNEHAKYELGVG